MQHPTKRKMNPGGIVTQEATSTTDKQFGKSGSDTKALPMLVSRLRIRGESRENTERDSTLVWRTMEVVPQLSLNHFVPLNSRCQPLSLYSLDWPTQLSHFDIRCFM